MSDIRIRDVDSEADDLHHRYDVQCRRNRTNMTQQTKKLIKSWVEAQEAQDEYEKRPWVRSS